MTTQLTFIHKLTSAIILSLFIISGTYADEDNSIPLKDVPIAVIKTAKDAVKGIVIEKAEVEEENGVTVYEIKGTTKEFEYELEISKDGKLLELKQERKKD